MYTITIKDRKTPSPDNSWNLSSGYGGGWAVDESYRVPNFPQRQRREPDNDIVNVIDSIAKAMEQIGKPVAVSVDRNQPVMIAYPVIKQVIVNNRTTICIFEDGKKTKATCMEGDKFDVRIGISLCIMKYMKINLNKLAKKAYYQKNDKDENG